MAYGIRMPETHFLSSQLTHMDTSDAVWEWHVQTDALHITLGARRLLALETNPPSSMAALLALCHEEKRGLIQQALQTFLEGFIGAHMEICFPINGVAARTQLVTLARNNKGKAKHVLAA